jgi:ABC-type branched-subunit amino acid transport system ATPase component
MAEPQVVLQTTGLTRRFGGLRAVDNVDLRIR